MEMPRGWVASCKTAVGGSSIIHFRVQYFGVLLVWLVRQVVWDCLLSWPNPASTFSTTIGLMC